MSLAGNSVQIVWVIQKNPLDEASIFGMPMNDQQLGVFLFTQQENANDFACSCPDIPKGAVITFVEVRDLVRVLTKLAQHGYTHVVTDPILGAVPYLDQQTLAVAEYIARLQR